MTLPNEAPLKRLQFYVTTPYQCGYLPKKLAQSLIASPQNLVDGQVYGGLIQQGFRRSGKFAYRPHCENCSACIPIRIRLENFKPNRSQLRAYRNHADLEAIIQPLNFQEKHFELYTQYQKLRHPEEALNTLEEKNEAEQYRQFLCQSNVESLMVEFQDTLGIIKIVCVIDVVQDGISAVYTYYDAANTKASYGTFAIIWLSEWTKSLNLPYLYLGYWIAESPKMAYKQQFKPQERLIDGEWLTFD